MYSFKRGGEGENQESYNIQYTQSYDAKKLKIQFLFFFHQRDIGFVRKCFFFYTLAILGETAPCIISAGLLVANRPAMAGELASEKNVNI